MGRKAIIVGCGVGGPIAALALQRSGIESTIYESHEHAPEGLGQCFNLTANGLDVLHTLGLDATHLADAVQVPRLVLWNDQGQRMGELPNGLKLRDGTVSVIVERRLLQRVLRAEAERAGVEVETGRRLANYYTDGRAIVAQFEDGGEATADVLIGADGLRSKTRQLMNPRAAEPRYAGLLAVTGIARQTGLDPTPGVLNLVFGRSALFEYTVRDSGDVYWFAAVPREHEPMASELMALSGDAWRKQASEVFQREAPLVCRIIEASTSELGAYPVHELPQGAWRKGSVALIGDAAHSILPTAWQGAALAMEDGLVAALCLRDTSEVPEALERYETLRRPRVERMSAYARTLMPGLGRGGVLTRWLRGRLAPKSFGRRVSPERREWIYNYHVDWSTVPRAA
jgi:2-polyprenyl-6-methoxyphenol hydroxylase-like FAD-dependent oxidoreductase